MTPGPVHPREPGQGHGPGAGENLDDLPGHRCFAGVAGPDNVFQPCAPVQDHLIQQGPDRSGKHEVSPFDLLGDHGLQQGRAAADELVHLAREGAGNAVAERRLQHVQGFDLCEVGEPDFGQLAGSDEPVESRAEGRCVRWAVAIEPRRPGLQQVEQHAGAQFVQGAGVVQQDDALPSGGVVADQGGDAVQDGGRGSKGALRQAGERERQATVGCRRPWSRAAELKGVDVRAEPGQRACVLPGSCRRRGRR